MRTGSDMGCCDLQGYLEKDRKLGKVTTCRKQCTHSGSDSSLSETAGTTLSGGNSAGRTAVRPLWITSITYLREQTSPVVRNRVAPGSTQAGEYKINATVDLDPPSAALFKHNP